MSKTDTDKTAGKSTLRGLFPDKETAYFSLLYLLHVSSIVDKIIGLLHILLGFPSGSAGKQSACNAGDLGSIRRLGRSPGEGKGYPFQYFGLENSMDCIAHGVSRSWLQLRNLHFTSLPGYQAGPMQSQGPSQVEGGKGDGRQASRTGSRCLT